jgi:hypothetical protein
MTLQERYDKLLAEHELLKKEVKCDYYEAYLLEKLRREELERKFRQSSVKENQVHQIAGWEYYDR